jgi:catechol 2,3-dioxygenase-like lactoylglutathione lyase family enzyme
MHNALLLLNSDFQFELEQRTFARKPSNVMASGYPPEQHQGITHFALLCPDIIAAKERLEAAGIPLSGGPIRFGPEAQRTFVRDSDRNVIELHQRG